jgi:hypothetical protein
VLVLAVGMTARITVAAPRATVSELRAISCCIAHCPASKPRPAKMPHQCCAIDARASDPAGTSTVPSLERPALAPIALLSPMPAMPVPAGTIASLDGPSLRAGPPVVTDVWWLPAAMAPLFIDHELQCIRHARDLGEWFTVAAQHGLDSVTIATFRPFDSAAIEAPGFDVETEPIAVRRCIGTAGQFAGVRSAVPNT